MKAALLIAILVAAIRIVTPVYAANAVSIEDRLKSLETQVGSLQKENAELRTQIGTDSKSATPMVVPNAKATTQFSLGGRFQVQYDGISTDVANAADPAPVNHFFVRRTYLVLKAYLGSDRQAQVDITYDFPANSFDAAYLNWKQSDSLAFDFGLRKVNFAAEEKGSSGALKAIERSAATRYFVEDNNGRRLGAGSYRIGAFAEGNHGGLGWSLAVTSPERASTASSLGTAASNTPAVWAGAGFKRKFQGGSFLVAANLGSLPDQGGRTTGTGSDLIVGSINTDVTVGNFTVVAEYLASHNERGSAAGRDASSWGYYVLPSYKFDRHWEVAARYSYVDTDGRGITLTDGLRSPASGGTMDKLSEYYAGFTYYFAGNDLKFQAGYVRGESRDTLTGAAAKATASGVRSQMQVQF